MGTSTEPWALDNERPAHPVHVDAFVIDTAPVTNGDYPAFVDAGGYDDPRWWTAAGLGAPPATPASSAPRFWERDGDGWWHRGSAVPSPLPLRPAGRARQLLRGRGLRGVGGQAAADRGGVGEGRPLRPGHRAVPALPVGRRRPDPAHANLGQRHLAPRRSAPTRPAPRRSASTS